MRGAFPACSAFVLILAACSGRAATVADAPPPAAPREASAPPTAAPAPPEENFFQFPRAPNAEEAPVPGGGIKGAADGAGVVAVRAEKAPKHDPDLEEVIKLQKEIAARHPTSDDDKLRLAALYASNGRLEEAERALSGLRPSSNKMAPYILYFVYRQLGDHKEAGKLLDQFNEEERQAVGFVIGRAELCSRVKRYREYVPAEGDRVSPGGVVLLYVEPRNFTLQRNQDKYILHLRYEWKLYDDRSNEQVVPAWENAPVSDREDRNIYNGPVNEFYQSFKLPLPANLAMGHYRVKVTVTDVHAGKSDRVYIPIYVTAVEGKR